MWLLQALYFLLLCSAVFLDHRKVLRMAGTIQSIHLMGIFIDVEVLSVLLERAPGAANEKNKDGSYPLNILCENKNSTLEMRSILEAASPLYALCGMDYITVGGEHV